MPEVFINNDNNYKEIVPDELTALIKRIYSIAQLPDKGELSVTFMDDAGIALLNEQFRNKKGATDVLSFPQHEGMEFPHMEDENHTPLIGDIVISVETAVRQAEEASHSLQKEITILLIHGILHLYGFDHYEPEETEEMKALEEKTLTKVLEKN